MGMNSTEVSYGFGQLGSIHCQTASSVYPPKDMVIVAIQFIADNTPTVMRPEAQTVQIKLCMILNYYLLPVVLKRLTQV